jgi:hypothetical protein
MVKKKPTWQEKLNKNMGGAKISVINEKLAKSWGSGTVVIPEPIEVDAYMRSVPKGKVTTINEIRQALAKKYGATIGCPITTGIFAWIMANASEEAKMEGKTDTTPYWRTLKVGGLLNEKYPGGTDIQTLLLEQEGHIIVQKGKKFYVKDYEKALYRLDQ